jgi:tight adherence protein C
MLLYIGLGAIALALAITVLAVGVGSSQPVGVAKSLAIIERQVSADEVSRADLPLVERVIIPLLDRFRALAGRLSPSGHIEKLSRQLELAGNPGTWTPERIMGAKGAGLSMRGLMFAAVLGVFCFFVPNILVYNAGLKRQEELGKGLSNALDMLTVCVEAGQGFDAAMLQVARSAKGPVAGEFARVLSEIQIGKSRGDAFVALGRRTSDADVKSFVTALVQADRLGLPIAGVLREQSNQMRIARRQKAEEKAQKVPIKILFPMLFCIFPALFIVIIGPGAIRMMGAFSGM